MFSPIVSLFLGGWVSGVEWFANNFDSFSSFFCLFLFFIRRGVCVCVREREREIH